MASICPRDYKVCIDDLCRGSGTCLNGNYMLERCCKCGEIYDFDLGLPCSCDSEPGYYDDDEEDGGAQ